VPTSKNGRLQSDLRHSALYPSQHRSMLEVLARSLSICRLQAAHRLASAARAASTSALQRGEQYARLEAADVEFFRGVLGDKGVITDPDALEPYNS
jgi:hypothetical protein